MPAPKLTTELRDDLCHYLGRGHYINGACGLVGIHKSTYFDWIERGTIARVDRDAGRKLPPRERVYLEFVDAVEIARDKGEGWLLEEMLAAKSTEWQKYATALERSRPDRWRRRAAVEFMRDKDAPPAPLVFDPEKLDADELNQLVVLLKKAAPTEE